MAENKNLFQKIEPPPNSEGMNNLIIDFPKQNFSSDNFSSDLFVALDKQTGNCINYTMIILFSVVVIFVIFVIIYGFL
jgi:hypothetical protein